MDCGGQGTNPADKCASPTTASPQGSTVLSQRGGKTISLPKTVNSALALVENFLIV